MKTDGPSSCMRASRCRPATARTCTSGIGTRRSRCAGPAAPQAGSAAGRSGWPRRLRGVGRGLGYLPGPRTGKVRREGCSRGSRSSRPTGPPRPTVAGGEAHRRVGAGSLPPGVRAWLLPIDRHGRRGSHQLTGTSGRSYQSSRMLA
jgi:hypothetical protein